MLTADDVRAIDLFSTLAEGELERLARNSEDLHLGAGEFAVPEGGERALFAVLSGKIEVVKLFDGIERRLGWRVPGNIFGEVPARLWHDIFQAAIEPSSPRASCAWSPGSITRSRPRRPTSRHGSAPCARERIAGLQGLTAEPPKTQVTIFGPRWDSGLRRAAAISRPQPDFPRLDNARPTRRRIALGGKLSRGCRMSSVAAGRRDQISKPKLRDVARVLGLQTSARLPEYDTVIIGGGPAGLAAAVYGASEGLRTLVVEREAPGGQAGTSSRIENYLGFPNGVSGDELASRALQQARRLGAEFLVTRSVAGLEYRPRASFCSTVAIACARGRSSSRPACPGAASRSTASIG